MHVRTTGSSKSCPACGSELVVKGKVIEGGSETGWGQKFFPSGLRFLSLKRSVRLLDNQVFQACTQCGHVWSTLDATDLRELIESKGTEALKDKLK
jgi:predicted RNA-binding Zn-ribbon protein involved in translation (DUF1610 family)